MYIKAVKKKTDDELQECKKKHISRSVHIMTDTNKNYALNLVRNNLVHYQVWSDVNIRTKKMEWRDQTYQLISGRPPHKLTNDSSEKDVADLEYVFPVEMCDYKNDDFTLECLNQAFIQLCDEDCKRLTLAIVNNDGTVVFYFAYKGIKKPKRN